MGVNPSTVKRLFDADAAVTLRDITDGAETTASVFETAISLSQLGTAYWQDNEVPHGTFVVVVNVTALDLGTGAPLTTITVRVDDVLAMNDSPVTVVSQVITTVGTYEFPLDSKSIDLLNSADTGGAAWIDVGVLQTGTSPTITYGAWLAEVISA